MDKATREELETLRTLKAKNGLPVDPEKGIYLFANLEDPKKQGLWRVKNGAWSRVAGESGRPE